MGEVVTREEREKIAKQRDEITKRLNANHREREHILSDLKLLQDNCPHPKLIPTSHQGERAEYCPLCGWES